MTANVSNSTSDAAARCVELPAEMKAQQLVVFYTFFRQWTGTAAMRRSDYEVGKDGSIPSEAVTASYGLKKVIDPKRLSVFDALKKRAFTVLENAGLPFCKGTVVPVTNAPAVSDELRSIAEEYNRLRAELLANLPAYYQEWNARNPEFASRLPQPSANVVAEKINADFAVFAFQPAGVGVDKNDSLTRSVNGLFDEVIHDVAGRAKQLLTRSVLGKTPDDLSQRTLNAVRMMSQKLQSLQFINSGVRPLRELVDRLLSLMPAKGSKFSPNQYATLSGALALLCDESLLRSVAAGSLTLERYLQTAFPNVTIPAPDPTLFAQTNSAPEPAPAPAFADPLPGVPEENSPECVPPEARAEAFAESETEDALPAEFSSESETKAALLGAESPEPELSPAPEPAAVPSASAEPAEQAVSNVPATAAEQETEALGDVQLGEEEGPSEVDLDALLKSCFGMGGKTEDSAAEGDEVIPTPADDIPPAPAAIRLSAF